MTLRLLIVMMKVHHQLLCEFGALCGVKLNCNQSAVCKHCLPFFQKIHLFLKRLLMKAFYYKDHLCAERAPAHPRVTHTLTHTHTITDLQCVIIMMKYDEIRQITVLLCCVDSMQIHPLIRYTKRL